MPNDLAKFHAIMTGQDGPAAPIAHESTYSWPTSADDATWLRLARSSIHTGLIHQRQANERISELGFMKAMSDQLWVAEQTAAQLYSDRAVLLLALAKTDPDLAAKVALDLWETSDDGGTEASLNYAARAMGIPLPAGPTPRTDTRRGGLCGSARSARGCPSTRRTLMADEYVPGGPAVGSRPTAWADEWVADRAEIARLQTENEELRQPQPRIDWIVSVDREWLRDLTADRDRLAAVIDQVRALHRANPEQNCEQCADIAWPCPTAALLPPTPTAPELYDHLAQETT